MRGLLSYQQSGFSSAFVPAFFAKNFLLHNQDVSLPADLPGHSKIGTTRIYLRQTKEAQRETVNRIVNW